jgi:hypothetical protein
MRSQSGLWGSTVEVADSAIVIAAGQIGPANAQFSSCRSWRSTGDVMAEQGLHLVDVHALAELLDDGSGAS